ncbi:MAG: hypothetical protein HY561_07680, partial [Gemmatimonadetes bacterium]|nr:hypothetical protein [Gemmatimonadota bacterium]
MLASCDTIEALVREELRFTPSREDGLFELAGWREQHTGCEISGQGTYAPIEPGMLPITTLVRALEARGWGDSPRYESEGDYSVAWSLARAGVLCVLRETSLVEDETDEADT